MTARWAVRAALTCRRKLVEQPLSIAYLLLSKDLMCGQIVARKKAKDYIKSIKNVFRLLIIKT